MSASAPGSSELVLAVDDIDAAREDLNADLNITDGPRKSSLRD
jgi:hypothetical protein